MSKKERRVTLIRFDQRRIRRLRPLARLVSGLLPWCGPLSLLAGCAAMALERLSLRQLLLELRMTELLAALALGLSTLENLFPVSLVVPLPGVKLGLANIVTVFALYLSLIHI